MFANNPETLVKYEERVKSAAPVLKENIKYFIFTTGGETDGASRNTPPTRDIFTKYGINSELSEMDGGHKMYVWRQDLRNFAQKLFK
jgi:enterochelin esterase-like enzyme